MPSSIRRPAFAIVTALLLASFCCVLVGGALIHTDDGCTVERHCLTCRWAAGTIGVVTPDLSPVFALEWLGAVAVPAGVVVPHTAADDASSRGPPQA